MTDRALLSDMRRLFHGDPTPQRWEAVLALLKDWPWMSVQIGVDYANAAGERWPDAVRRNAPWMSWEAAHPAWATVRHLDLSRRILDAEALAALARSQRLERITHLNLNACAMGDEGIAALAASPYLINLRRLSLVDNALTAAGARALAASEAAAGLHRLDLSENPITDLGMRPIAVATTGLSHLALRRTGITTETAEAIADSSALEHLDLLDLEDNHLDMWGARAIAGATRMRQLQHLRLGGNPIADEGAEALADTPWLPALRHLGLDRCHIGPEGIAALARSPHTARLRHLDLRGNTLDEGAATHLLDAPQIAALQSLRITWDGKEIDGLDALSTALGLDDAPYTNPLTEPHDVDLETLVLRERMLLLNALLKNTPDEALWTQILGAFEDWHDDHALVGLRYVEDNLPTAFDTLDRLKAPWMRWDEPHMAWTLVRHLHLTPDDFDPRDLRTLARAVHLSALTQLTFEGIALAHHHQTLLAMSPHLKGCRIVIKRPRARE